MAEMSEAGCKAIVDGFAVNWISLRDFGSKRVLWRSEGTWELADTMIAEVPAEILTCRSVAREINFSTV
jgi:hypothetical protein